jgi:hypothetical protein
METRQDSFIEVLDRGHELFLQLFMLETAAEAATSLERLPVDEIRAALLAQLEVAHQVRRPGEAERWASEPPDVARWLGRG